MSSIINKKVEVKKRRGKKKSKRLALTGGPHNPSLKLTPVDRGLVVQGLLKDTKRDGFPASMLKKQIPYLLPSFMKKSQVMEIRLTANFTTVSTVSATDFAPSVTVQGNLFNNTTELSTVFDEYRVVRGELIYFPTTNYTSAGSTWASVTGFCVAAIDYANATVFSSISAAWASDNKQAFYLVNHIGNTLVTHPTKGSASWPLLFEELPDQFWIAAVTLNTAFCYWKCFSRAANVPGTGECGQLGGWMDFQYRGLTA
jgi:hypothetical protein